MTAAARHLAIAGLFSLLLSPSARTQTKPPDPPKTVAPADPLGRSTPRGTVAGFLSASHRQDYTRAIEYLDTRLKGDTAKQLAIELALVLDRKLPTTNVISDLVEGSAAEGLPLSAERVGTIGMSTGPLDVTLDREHRGGQSIWLFSDHTLEKIPAAAKELGGGSYLDTYLPAPLVKPGFLSISIWKWLALLLGGGLAVVVSGLTARLLARVFRPIAHALTKERDLELVETLAAPLRALVVIAVVQFTVVLLELPFLTRQLWSSLAGKLTIVAIAWLFVRFVRVLGDLACRHYAHRAQSDTTAVIRLAQRTVNVLTTFLAIVLLVRTMGYDVTAALAGLGVGGIALAFAAQKTLENLFGGVSIIFDRPMRVGDFCKMGDRMGTVEDIGLRSTRFRTPDRTVLTIPNGQLSTMNIENFGLRDRFFFAPTIGIRYDTKASQIPAILDKLRAALAANALVDAASVRVSLVKYAESAIIIEFNANIITTEFAKFMKTQEDLLLKIRETLEENCSGISVPSQVLYITRESEANLHVPLPESTTPPPAA